MKKSFLAILFFGLLCFFPIISAGEILYEQTSTGGAYTCNYNGSNKYCGMAFNDSSGFTFNDWTINFSTQSTWLDGVLQSRVYQVSDYNSPFSSGTLIATSENTFTTPIGSNYYTFNFSDTVLQDDTWYVFLIYVTDSGSGTNKWTTVTRSSSNINGNYSNRYNTSSLYDSAVYDWTTIIGYDVFSECSDIETEIDYSDITLPYTWNNNTYDNVAILKKYNNSFEVTYFSGSIASATRVNATNILVTSDGFVVYETYDLSDCGNPVTSGSGSIYITSPSVINDTNYVASMVVHDIYSGTCYNQNFYKTFRCAAGDFYQTSGYYGQCVAYVENETGIDFSVSYAYQWYQEAIDQGYYVSSTPEISSIIVFASQGSMTYGHIGIVTSIDGDDITIQDANWDLDGYIQNHEEDISGYDILGYIYCTPSN